MSTPLTWNANILSSDGHSRTVDFRGKWVNYRDSLQAWKPVDVSFRRDGNNLISDASPWAVSCPDNATKPITVVNRQSWDVQSRAAFSAPDLVSELRHPGARSVSPVLIPGREFQVVYPDAIDDGIDIVVGQWHARGVRAEHLYVIRTAPPGNNDVTITSQLTASGVTLPIPDNTPIDISNGASMRLNADPRRGVTLRPAVGWYYDANGVMVRKPIQVRMVRTSPGIIQLIKTVPRALIAEALAARPGGELRVDTTSTFYPDPNTETTSVDGQVTQADKNGISWSALRNGAGTDASDNLTSGDVINIQTGPTNTYAQMDRGVYLFDTSALPDGDAISAAVFSVYGTGKGSDFTVNPLLDINVYSSAPASNTSLAAGDYDSLGTTAFCDTAISNGSYSTSGYNDVTFNATGLAAITATGVTKLGTRNANYDVADSAVPWELAKYARLSSYFAEQAGTSQDPKLVVTHAVAGQPAVKRFGGVPFAHSLGRGVW